VEYQRVINECAESFYEVTQIPVSVLDRDGMILHSYGEPCAYCTQFQKLVGNVKMCERRHILGCRVAAELKKSHVFQCHGGLVMFAVGLLQDGKHVFSILAGPVLPEMPSLEIVDDLLKKMSLPLSGRSALYAALLSVSLVEARKIEYMSRLLHTSTMNLLDTASSVIQETNEQAEENIRVNAYLNAIQVEPELKTNDKQIRDLEDKLVHAVRAGNVQDAKSFIEQLFSTRSIYSGLQTQLTTIHAIELLTLVARTAIEAGAGVHAMYKLTNRAFLKLMQAQSNNQISLMLAHTVEMAISLLEIVETNDTTALIRQGIYYIHQHYTEDITLEAVAGYVHVSSSYFSSLFKEKTSVSFTVYVNRMKIERAKKLLKNSEMTLTDIAMALGFCSQSYFSSVFKKHVGMSPKQFRYDSTEKKLARV
jgi:YesN/AraC family two-component response regulator